MDWLPPWVAIALIVGVVLGIFGVAGYERLKKRREDGNGPPS